ncbi:hypothetical protein, partial [Cardinium endosymbiont of Culicoides punctatus]|uniref:hypothetical protein n=1 Tax=Cardinium endosymbiont of Culicoides punctatus TaxID=2304601 RepID=UPI001405055C
MFFQKNTSIETVLLCLILSLFSCKTNKYAMDGKKLEDNLEIGHDAKRQKLAYTGVLPICQSDIRDVIHSGYYADKTE